MKENGNFTVRDTIRTYVRTAYDLQQLRIQTSNRIVANFKRKLGQDQDMTEDELESWAKTLLTTLRTSHKKLSDAMPKNAAKFAGDGVITEYAEFALIKQFLELEKNEDAHFNMLEKILQPIPIFKEFLSKTKGIGPALAGVIISELDPHQAPYPSSFWMYAGLDVVYVQDEKTGEHRYEGRSRRANHLIDREYVDKDGKPATRKSITYNPFLKTKLMGVMASSFLRASSMSVDGERMGAAKRLELAKSSGFDPKAWKIPAEQRIGVIVHLRAKGHLVEEDNSPYQVEYTNYKNRLNNSPRHDAKSDGHKHQMAMRYAVKRFLVDLHTKWRELEGYEATLEYSEDVLGMPPHRGDRSGRPRPEARPW